MFERACKIGLEGVVSKVVDSPYGSGRSRDWVKVTSAQRETLPIAARTRRRELEQALYGRQKGKDLVYAGKVDHGFDKTSAADYDGVSRH